MENAGNQRFLEGAGGGPDPPHLPPAALVLGNLELLSDVWERLPGGPGLMETASPSRFRLRLDQRRASWRLVRTDHQAKGDGRECC